MRVVTRREGVPTGWALVAFTARPAAVSGSGQETLSWDFSVAAPGQPVLGFRNHARVVDNKKKMNDMNA